MAGTVRKAVAGLGTPNETPARTKLPNSAEDRRFESISLQRGVSELSVPERRTDRRENIVTAAGGSPRVDRGVPPDRDGGGDRPIDPFEEPRAGSGRRGDGAAAITSLPQSRELRGPKNSSLGRNL